MSNPENHLETLSEIRSLMERSTRFLSLSGLSGVSAGVFALLGALAAYLYLDLGFWTGGYHYQIIHPDGSLKMGFVWFFILDALAVLILSLGFGIYFTVRKAKKLGLKVWDRAGFRVLENLLIPLATGGIFCLILLSHGIFRFLPGCTLIFYGLALLNASKYTLGDIRYLGISEIILGLGASVWIGYGMVFWAVGFGVLHILYGLIMYQKYETNY